MQNLIDFLTVISVLGVYAALMALCAVTGWAISVIEEEIKDAWRRKVGR